MTACDPGLRRVSVHAGTIHVDLALPAAVPVATLMPSIVDILGDCHGTDPFGDLPPTRLQLSRPGAPALGSSTTLAQNAIHDGAVLVLTREAIKLPAPCFDDAAEAVSATLDAATRRWTRRAAGLTAAVIASWLSAIGGLLLIRIALNASNARSGTMAGLAAFAGCIALLSAVIAHRGHRDQMVGLTLGLIAVGFLAVAGFLVVPGVPGPPNLLLAAVSAVTASVIAIRVTGCGTVTLTAVSGFGLVVAVSALAATINAAPPRPVAALSVLASLALLEVSPRLSLVLAGLSPRLPAVPDVGVGEGLASADRLATKAVRADNWSTGLLAAFSSSAATGAIGTAAAMPNGLSGLGGNALAAVTGAVLLLRARSQTDLNKTLIPLISGIATISTIFVVTAATSPQHGPWIAAATTLLAGVALCLGFLPPTMSFSPVLRRSVELLEYLALAAAVPLTCWLCGLYPDVYQATRNLNLLST